MAKQDYFPTTNDGQDTWFGTWLANIAALLASLVLPATQADAVKMKITNCRLKYTAWKNAKAQALAASNTYKATLKDTLKDLRPFNQNLKTTTGYSPALGNTVGIEGAESTFDETTAKSQGKAIYEGGQVTIEFSKPAEVPMVVIRCKRGDETAFSFVSTDTNSPYNDHRPNLDPMHPENREYDIQFMNKDSQLIGQLSDVVKIVVP